MSTLPLAAARARLSQLIEEAVRTHERIEITRNGVRAAVLLSSEDYDVLIETLDVLADADLVRELRGAMSEADRGEVFGIEDVRDEMRARGRFPQ